MNQVDTDRTAAALAALGQVVAEEASMTSPAPSVRGSTSAGAPP